MDTQFDMPADDVDDDGPPMPSEARIIASLERSRADMIAGRSVPWETVAAMLDAGIDEIRQKREAEQTPE